jgi:threonine-phosphate decarboxylase
MLAEKYMLTPAHVVLTNGAAEAFYLIAQAWRGTSATIVVPTFSEYEDAATLHDIALTFIEEDALAHPGLKLDTRLAFICNPNNPTGRSWPIERLVDLIRTNENTLFVIDEAYVDFTTAPQSLLPYVNELFNLVVIRGYTKTFALPGLRIGYTVSQPHIAAQILKFRIPWSVNSLALEACRYILDNEEMLRPHIGELLKETEWLQKEINTIRNLEALPSATPFFLVKLRVGNSTALKQYLADHWKCLVRDASNFRMLGNRYIRIATQSHDKNILLLNGLRAWTQSI